MARRGAAFSGTRVRAVIAHDRSHVEAAAEAARTTGRPVLILTAPGAHRYGGPRYLRRLIDEALAGIGAQGVAIEDVTSRIETMIDCGDDAAGVFRALEAGWQHILYRGGGKARRKLGRIVEASGAVLVSQAPRALDLVGVENPEAACRDWLQGRWGGM